MRVFAKAFAIVFVVVFLVGFLGMRRLGELGKVDSLGLWYTIYSAAVGAIIAAFLFAGTFAMLFHQWRPWRK